MPAVCFYFQVHQPFRVKRYSVFDIGGNHEYFDDDTESNRNNRRIIEKVAAKCYRSANATILELLRRHPEFKVSYSMSGVFLEQLKRYCPDVLASFQALAATGRAEFLSETYYHSLASLYDENEFSEQVLQHRRLIEQLFGVRPTVFRNTELIYSNEIAAMVRRMGFKGMLAEGADHILDWRSPNFVYGAKDGDEKFGLLLKNYRLSDDIAFRFSSRGWSEWPLTAPKFAKWVNEVNGNGVTVNLFMDYETFGEHQWAETGIFDFLRALPAEILRHPDNAFATPSEVLAAHRPVGRIDVPYPMSWADVERDLSAWRGNRMQDTALESIYRLGAEVRASGDKGLLDDWRKLQTSDHFYYMCTKWFADGDVHKYFNPYESPYDAFIHYMNSLQDVTMRTKGGVHA
ncbi:polysaccharide deacetylase family protein [Candidatus Uhrbacteria bacterium]|nr:polysaccharide deacetylase family protein [Candidatus Uhrbacteria bacterium]